MQVFSAQLPQKQTLYQLVPNPVANLVLHSLTSKIQDYKYFLLYLIVLISLAYPI